jgi:hypothetical protein
MDAKREGELAAALGEVLRAMATDPAVKRLRMRTRELGANVGDEVAQFRLLVRAAGESPRLNAALEGCGFRDLARFDPRKPAAVHGELVQVFNRFVEDEWADR